MARSAFGSIWLAVLGGLVGCGDDGRVEVDAQVPGVDAFMADAAEPDASEPDASTPPDAGPVECPREPRPADRQRFVVVAHPFVPSYEVLALGTDGALSRPGTSFTMGKAAEAPIVFTADGEVGLVAQDDGTLGVFTLDETGAPTVVHAGYDGDFYAAQVVMDPDGEHAWVLDSQWRETGGGIYRLTLGCDGSIEEEELVAMARLPYGMGFEPDGHAIVASKDILDTTLGPDLHRVDLSAPSVLASVDIFGDDDWIVAGFALSARHAFLGDNAGFSSEPNRVAVAGLGESALVGLQRLEVEDPASIVVSPFEDRVLVVSAFGDAIFQYAYDPDAAEPLTPMGELAYAERGPALPTVATMVRRGALEGLALISENVAVRRVQFAGDGVVTDLGPLELGSGTESIAGALGVQP